MKMVDLVNDGQMVIRWCLRKMHPLPLYPVMCIPWSPSLSQLGYSHPSLV